MRVLITGAEGQLGIELVNRLQAYGYETFGFGRDELDITDNVQVSRVFGQVNPQLVIHAAAYTNVNGAELESDQAYLVNETGTAIVASAAEQLRAKLVYVSTDYVFDGTSAEPYNENHSTSPLNVYGKSKLAGEQAVQRLHSRFFVVRTSWMYGMYGDNFLMKMLRLSQERDKLSIVDDQTASPTYTADLAECMIRLVQTEHYGIYHVSNSGECSWYEFAKHFFQVMELPVQVNSIGSNAFPSPAVRPAYSVMAHKIGRAHV